VPVTSSDLQSVREATLERIGNDDQRRSAFERSWAEVPKPVRYPYWGSAIVDLAGNLWVSSYGSPSAPRVWTVFDTEGRRISQVQLPPKLRVTEIGADYVLGVEQDDLDVEYVRLYPLTRRSR